MKKQEWLIACLLAISLVLSSGIAAKRILEARAASEIPPGTAITSGCEEESIFALWRVARGENIYLPKDSPPYAGTYFNWAFYSTYGSLTSAFWKSNQETKAIFAGRILTAAVAVLGAGISIFGFRCLLGKDMPWMLAVSLAFFAFTGPLVGWWLVTIRPDVCALVAEAGSAWLFLRFQRDQPQKAILATIAGSYVAWSFKPTSLTVLFTICAFLLLRRRWLDFAKITATLALLWMLTLVVGGSCYRASILDTATNNVFYPALGISNLFGALKASFPLIVFGILSLLSREKSPSPASDPQKSRDAAVFGLIGALCTTSLMLVASSKLGAAPNYFFTLPFMLAIGSAGLLAQKTWSAPALGFALASIVLQFGLVLGWWGSLSLQSQTVVLAKRWALFEKQPEPRFSADLRLNLPWLNPHSPTLMPAYNYWQDRAKGKLFQKGGIGGMIQTNVFESLLLPSNTQTVYDDASLDGYKRYDTAEDYAAFRKVSAQTR